MTTQQFAAWVEPWAQSYSDVRREGAARARTATAAELSQATGDEGWTVREELLHLAASDTDFIDALGAMVDGRTPDTDVFIDIDARNKRNLAKWQSRSMEDVASALEHNIGTLHGLLGRLTADDERRRPDGIPLEIGQLVKGYGQHSPYHLAQIRDALARAD